MPFIGMNMAANTLTPQQKLDHLKNEIQKMQRDTTHGAKKPHKIVMLLAVLDLFERQVITENKIYFDDELVMSFSNIFNLIRSKGDWDQAAPPFFHLRTSSFWKHKVKDGCEKSYSKLSTSGGGFKRIQENIEYAYLSDDAFEIVSDVEARQSLREFMISMLNPLSNFENPAPVSRLQQRGK
jgi:predicted restriction endonuclease